MVSGELSVAGAQARPLDRISATDEDGLHAGTVTFSVVGDGKLIVYLNFIIVNSMSHKTRFKFHCNSYFFRYFLIQIMTT